MQLPHIMEPQLCAQVETAVPINQFHCTLYQVNLLDTFWLRIVAVSCGCIYHMLLANLHVLENLTVVPVSLLTTLHTCRQLPTDIQ